MGVEIKLTDRELPVSPVFVDFLTHIVEDKPFGQANWHDQLSEELNLDQKQLLERAAQSAQRVMDSPVGQRHVQRAYELFVALLTGTTEKIRDIQFKFHFINVIGVPRNGGSYLTKELYRALGYDPERVPNAIAHDGFPEAGPFRFAAKVNSWTTSLQTMAEFLTMVEIFFGKARPHTGKVVVPKKLTKGTYAGGFFHRVLGESVENILTVRHPVASCISTYDKSGGLPEDNRFAVRSNIEDWVRRDLIYTTGIEPEEVLKMEYFDAYLHYWEQYHYYVATTGFSANRNTTVVPYNKEHMEALARRFQYRFESELEPSPFQVFDNRARHREWMDRAEPSLRRVAELWDRVGLSFPLEEVMEAW